MEERQNETQNESNDRTATIIELMFRGMILPPPFIFWFTALMGVISVFVIIQRTIEYQAGDITFYYGVFNGLRDIGVAIPVVSLVVALGLNVRSASMTLSSYFQMKADEVRKRNEARSFAAGKTEGESEGEARGLAKALAWNERKAEAERKGELFDEPFPGSEEGE